MVSSNRGSYIFCLSWSEKAKYQVLVTMGTKLELCQNRLPLCSTRESNKNSGKTLQLVRFLSTNEPYPGVSWRANRADSVCKTYKEKLLDVDKRDLYICS